MAGPSLSPQAVVRDRHLAERGFFVDMDHPEMGTVRLPRLPLNVNHSPFGRYEHAPSIGEHNDYVFRELLKMPEEEIAQLQEEQVIF